MAGGFWRGQAAQRNIFNALFGDYMAGLGGGQFEDLLGTLWDVQAPAFGELMGQFGHQAASLGQAVPGQGFSGAGQEGERDLAARFASNIMGTALGTYAMPWQGMFGATGGIGQDYMGGRQIAKYEQAAPWQDLAGFAGGLGGSYLEGGGGCCFILTEANDGVLDDIHRRYRDEHGSAEQKSGYRRLANWLVPKMRQSRTVKNLVKFFMVKPITYAGQFLYGQNHWGYIFAPIAMSWLMLFHILGAKKNYDFVYSPSA